jgi:hypothetical protein
MLIKHHLASVRSPGCSYFDCRFHNGILVVADFFEYWRVRALLIAEAATPTWWAVSARETPFCSTSKVMNRILMLTIACRAAAGTELLDIDICLITGFANYLLYFLSSAQTGKCLRRLSSASLMIR